jgi:glycosyltransferase involved in cell wall biosynthesis
VTTPIPGVPPGAAVIGTVARLSPEKDQQTLLDAFARLCELRDDCRLVIAGEGPARSALAAHAGGLPCRDKIIFLGTVERVPELLRMLTVFVLTSLTEGVSLSLLEAGATGIPAVVTDAGGNAEVVEDGVTGFVVPIKRPDIIAEKIDRLLADESLRASMGRLARERIIAHFSLAHMTRRYEALYRECYDG